MINLSSLTYPDSTVVDYTYLSSGNRLDADLGRVTRVRIDSTAIAEYDYNGVGSLVGVEHAESDIFMTRAVGTHYDALDRFGRVVTDTWTKTTTSNGDKGYYDVDIAWGDGTSDDAAQAAAPGRHDDP